MNLVHNYQLFKRWELYFILFLILASVIAGWNPSLDLDLARIYYHPDQLDNPWPDKYLSHWQFFYHAAPIISGIILLPSIFVYVGSYLNSKLATYRRHAAYVFLAALLGPGILINTVFKPYWGRPRPRQVLELGGTEKMHAYWQKGKAGNGYSFPCGHSSVGFALISFYFLLKRKRPKTAIVVFAGSFVLGMIMGVGRMADGAHFFSDVLWSAVMSYIPAYFLYYKMRLYEEETKEFKKEYKKAILQGASLFAALLAAVAVATPYKRVIDLPVDKNLQLIEFDEGVLEIRLDENQKSSEIHIEARGFGFPKSKLIDKVSPEKLIFYRKGFFSDYEATYSLSINDKNKPLIIKATKEAKLKPGSYLSEQIQLKGFTTSD